MTDHPITPSEDQIMLWCKQWNCTKEPGPIHKWLAIQAARWGADQELLACGNYLEKCASWEPEDVTELLNHRRPRPPSLKEQALGLLNEGPASDLLDDEVAVIRRALESLPS